MFCSVAELCLVLHKFEPRLGDGLPIIFIDASLGRRFSSIDVFDDALRIHPLVVSVIVSVAGSPGAF